MQEVVDLGKIICVNPFKEAIPFSLSSSPVLLLHTLMGSSLELEVSWVAFLWSFVRWILHAVSLWVS